MPIPSDLYEQISQLVAENRINSAIELLEAQLPLLRQNDPENYHAALILMQDFNEIQERRINGLLVAEEDTNDFSFRLLEFSRKLGRKFVPPPLAASPDPLRMAQPAYTTPPPRPATGPVNAKPGSRSSQSTGGSSITFGKMVLYGLAGLGVLVFLAVLMELGNDTEDSYNDTQQVYTPPNTTPADLSDTGSSVTIANLSSILGNSRWYGNVMGDLQFNESGIIGSYHNGASTLTVVGAEDGHYYGTYSDQNFGAMVISFSNNQNTFTLSSVDDAGNIIGELVLNRQ